jgi:phosphotriesterase-related protein
MIRTVLGDIDPKDMGVTLAHEHIIWDWNGADSAEKPLYAAGEAADEVEPYLLELKSCGCRTVAEATTDGAGRDIEVLRVCSERTGLNIITNCGMWDGGDFRGKYVPGRLKAMGADEIADVWTEEAVFGIGGTGVKPGFIKLALGDEGLITPLQEKMLRAASRTSRSTGLPVECHIGSSQSAKAAADIIEDEKLPFEKFAWIHTDWSNDYETVYALAKKGIWVGIDGISFMPKPYEIQIGLLKDLIRDGLTDRLLISQDAGCYEAGETRAAKLRPYTDLFNCFIPICMEQGIQESFITGILTENPARFFDAIKPAWD